jgi:hypothetical protein
MSDNLSPSAVTELQSIFSNRTNDYNQRLNDFKQLQDEVLAEHLPRVKKRERNIFLAKVGASVLVIGFIALKFV